MNDAANTYDPKAYWDTRAHPNTEEAPGLNQHDQSFMGSRLEDVQSVLEIGPGVGRLFPLYRSIPSVNTLDLTRQYRDKAKAAATAEGIKVNDAYLDTPLSPFPFEDKSIDVGIFSHVLMHIPFEIVNYPMSEAARCCRTVVVKSVMHRYWPRKGTEFDPKWHCFEHDYEAICKEIGCTYSDYELFSQQELQGAYGFVFSSSA